MGRNEGDLPKGYDYRYWLLPILQIVDPPLDFLAASLQSHNKPSRWTTTEREKSEGRYYGEGNDSVICTLCKSATHRSMESQAIGSQDWVLCVCVWRQGKNKKHPRT